MKETDFRIYHSMIIETYQHIEMKLKVLSSRLLSTEERGWFDRLDDYESDSLGKMLVKIRDIQDKKNIELFSSDDFTKMENMRQARNYWAHECFGGMTPIVFNKGIVKRPAYATRLVDDLKAAEEIESSLAEKASLLKL